MIKAGDTVMLVWTCCREDMRHIGWKGEVEKISSFTLGCRDCGYKSNSANARITIEPLGTGWVPISWLIKLPPPGEEVYEQRDEEAHA